MIPLIIFLGLILAYFLLNRPYKYWKNRGVKQGKPWPVFGDSWGMIFMKMDMAEMTCRIYKSIPDVRYYGVYQFFRPKLVIRDADLINKITIKDFDHFVDHTAMVDPKADRLFAKNLISLKGEEWRNMRSTLTGSFTSSKLKIMFDLLDEAAENFANFYYKQKENVEIEFKDSFTRFTIDIIATTSFGVKVNSLEEPDNRFFHMGKEIAELNLKSILKIMLFQFSPKLFRFFNLSLFRKEVNDFFRTLIDDTILMRESEGTYRPDMIQILMETRKNGKEKMRHLTNEDITAQAVIFFFAGFDSVSSLMTFMAYELAIHQDIQDKLRKEISETLKKCNGNKITYEAVTNMKFMEMVVLETLRKWPPFVIVGRECTKTYLVEPVNPNEIALTIPKGMAIQIPAYAIHHDPNFYPNPEEFNPERFSSSSSSSSSNKNTFLSFGLGPRGCLGPRFALLETKLLFFHLLNKFKLEPFERTQIPLKLSKKFSINIRPEKGLWLALRKIT